MFPTLTILLVYKNIVNLFNGKIFFLNRFNPFVEHVNVCFTKWQINLLNIFLVLSSVWFDSVLAEQYRNRVEWTTLNMTTHDLSISVLPEYYNEI